MRSRRLLAGGLLVAAALLMPGAAVGASPISVTVITGFQCAFGSAPKKAKVVATLRTPNGHQRGKVITKSDSAGEWAACFAGQINGGDNLKIVAGNKSRTIAIPRMEPRIDRVANTIEGRAAPNSPIIAQINHRKTMKKTKDHTLDTVADGSGRYKFTTKFNLRGGDGVTVVAVQGNDVFGALVLAPVMQVVYAQNVVSGTANNGTDLVLELRDGHGALKADVTAGTSPLLFGISLFTVSLYDDDGSAAYPLDGDTLSATLASDAKLKLPKSALKGAAKTDVVSGRCMPRSSYELSAGGATVFGKTDANGKFTRNLSRKTNLRRGDSLALYCLYKTGDIWLRVGTVQ